MKFSRLLALAALLVASPAAAQWQTPNHSVPIGRGVGVTGFGSVAPGAAGLALVSNGASADPSYQALPFVVGTTPVTNGTSGAPLYNNGGVLGTGTVSASWSTFVAYSATAPRTVQAKLQDTFSVLDYVGSTGCVADQTTDCSAAFNAAVTAAYNYSVNNPQLPVGGTVYVPPAPFCYRIHASTINLLKNVSIKGAGTVSCIVADDVNAITLNYFSGFGMPTVSDLLIVGENATAGRTAIKATGSLTDSNVVLYGLTVRNASIYGFDTAVSAQTVLTIWVTNSWAQNINHCVTLIGWSGIAKINGLECVYANGGGTSATPTTGISFQPFTYTTGGVLQPEGTEISQTGIASFATALDIQAAGFVTFSNGDISASVDGIKYANVYGGLYVNHNYIALISATGAHGIYAVGTSGTTDNQTVIDSNTFISSTSTISTGVQINDTGGAGNTNVNIKNNLFDGMGAHDIFVYGPNGVNIDSNWARSTTTTDSINVNGATGGNSFITNNTTAKAIAANSSDLTNGIVREAGNIVNGTRQAATWNVETGSTTANRPMLGGGPGVQPSALAAGTATTVLHGSAGGAPTYSAVSLTADVANVLPVANGGTGAALTKLAWSATAPTVASGFCTSPSVSSNNGTAAFALTIGSACAGSVGVLTMPAASAGWACNFRNVTNNAANALSQTASTTTSVSVTNYVRTTGAAGNFTASDVIVADCTAY